MSMSSTSGSYSNPLRIVGMASGLDTDALVKAMMQAKTHPIDLMKQHQQVLSWQRDQYRDMNTLFAGLQTSVSNLRYQYNFAINKSTTDNTSVTATAGGTAVPGSYTMVVKQLAKSASLVGAPLGVASNQTQSLASQAMTLNVTGTTGTTQVNIASGSSISSIVSAINGATTLTGVVASYDSATDRLYLNGNTTGSSSTIMVSGADAASQTFLTNNLKISSAASVTGTTTTAGSNMNQLIDAGLAGPVSLNVNSQLITFDKTTTYAQLQSALTSAGTGVTVSIDSNNHVQLSSSGAITLGAAGTADANTSKDGLGELGLSAGTTASQAKATGTDTIVDYNGVTNIHFQTNSFTLNNITFGLTQPPAQNQVSASTGLTGAYDVHVTVGQDTDTIYNNIKSFVDSYNSLIDKVNTKLSEPRYRDYQPLTDDQKAAMKDTDITNWNQKAQSGLLQSDDTLQNAIFQLRNLTENPVNNSVIQPGQYKLLSDIGITEAAPGTTSAFTENGKLYIDDAKLKAAIASNPQQVVNMFTANGSETNMNQTGLDQGFAERLYRATTNVMTSLTRMAGSSAVQTDGSTMGLQITDLGNQITYSNSKLSDYQQHYYNQFAKLESLMSSFNSQKASLSAMLGSGGGQ